jgi:hypothetical protein
MSKEKQTIGVFIRKTRGNKASRRTLSSFSLSAIDQVFICKKVRFYRYQRLNRAFGFLFL